MKDLSGNILKTDKQGNNLHQALYIGNVTRAANCQNFNSTTTQHHITNDMNMN